jgi:putative FmdB family regulatory protein
MPVYTFKCNECEKTFDEFTFNYNAEKIECKCDKKAECSKTFASVSKAIFNGKGFYETDYKKSSK